MNAKHRIWWKSKQKFEQNCTSQEIKESFNI